MNKWLALLVISIISVWAFPLSVHAQAQGCVRDGVESVSTNGEILQTDDGAVYQTVDDVSDWEEGDDLLICPTSKTKVWHIINFDEKEDTYGTRLS